MDKKLNYGRLALEAKELHLAGYTAEQIRQAYGSGGKWFTTDWRGRKGELPALGSIRPTIKALLNGHGPSSADAPKQETAFDRLRKKREAANG
jgi:hypothetical protein